MSSRLADHPQALCNMARRIAVEAGDSTLALFDANGGFVNDATRQSALEARGICRKKLQDQLALVVPDVPVLIVGEDTPVPETKYAWIIDPLDGMDAFAEGRNEYCVTVAFIREGLPVLGIIYIPPAGELYAAAGPDSAIRWRADTQRDKPIRMRNLPPQGLCVVADTRQTGTDRLENFLSGQKVSRVLPRDGALKFTMMAAGKADLCAFAEGSDRLALAAGDALLQGAGGSISQENGSAMDYQSRDLPQNLMAASQAWQEFQDAPRRPPGHWDSSA